MTFHNARYDQTSHRDLIIAAGVLLALLMTLPANAESLFHARASYNAQAPLTPRSLYVPPIAHNVGDLVTVKIEESAEMDSDAELKIQRTQTLEGSPAGPWNTLVQWAVDRLPFVGDKVAEKLSAPTFSDPASRNQIISDAEASRKNLFKDTITCQVVQVLPNGDLMIQGHKTVMINRERQEVVLTGIVRPFFLDRTNTISSTKVANMQLLQGGKGVLSRQQNDGVASKIYNFFN